MLLHISKMSDGCSICCAAEELGDDLKNDLLAGMEVVRCDGVALEHFLENL